MKIRLTTSLPLDRKHGAVEGAEFEVLKIAEKSRLHWMTGKAGEEFGAFSTEFVVLEADPAPPVVPAVEPATPTNPANAIPAFSDDEKIETANEAITYFLDRMRGHEKLLYHMNHTRALELLCEAYAKLNGVSAEAVDNYFTGRTEEL